MKESLPRVGMLQWNFGQAVPITRTFWLILHGHSSILLVCPNEFLFKMLNSIIKKYLLIGCKHEFHRLEDVFCFRKVQIFFHLALSKMAANLVAQAKEGGVEFLGLVSTRFGVFGDNIGVSGLNDSYSVILLELVRVSFTKVSSHLVWKIGESLKISLTNGLLRIKRRCLMMTGLSYLGAFGFFFYSASSVFKREF